VGILARGGFLISFILSGLGARWSGLPPLLALPVTRVLSLRVAQLPQDGHFPLHLEASNPQSVQKKVVAMFSPVSGYSLLDLPKTGKKFFRWKRGVLFPFWLYPKKHRILESFPCIS